MGSESKPHEEPGWVDFQSGAGLELEELVLEGVVVTPTPESERRVGVAYATHVGVAPGKPPAVVGQPPSAPVPVPLLDEPATMPVALRPTRRQDATAVSNKRLRDDGELGRGGMGSVRYVRDRALRRHVAVKVLRTNPTDAGAQPRFLREVQILAQLEHPNIVPIYDAGATEGGSPSLTMRVVRGETLTTYLSRHELDRPENVEAFLTVFDRVCDAIAYAHSRGVVHRDLKPDNVMLGAHGVVYVMDWGCAGVMNDAEFEQVPGAFPEDRVSLDPTLTDLEREGILIGTANYMAPEQALGRIRQVGAQADVFGLGAILYTAMARVAPYPQTQFVEVVRAAQTGQPPAPEELRPGIDLPLGLIGVMRQAMAPDCRERIRSVEELQRALHDSRRTGYFGSLTFEAGDLLCAEGEPGNAAFIIQSGTATVYKTTLGRRVELRQLGPGAVVGETALMTELPRTASVEATSHVVAMRITRQSLDRDLGVDSWAGAIVRTLADRFRDLDAQLAAGRESRRQADLLAEMRTRLQATPGGELGFTQLADELTGGNTATIAAVRRLVEEQDDLTLDLEADTVALVTPGEEP